MKERLILLGAGDFAREVLWLVSEMPAHAWSVAGLLDDNPEKATATLRANGFTDAVLGTIREYVPQPHDRFVCTIAKPAAKLEVAGRIASREGKFINLVHPLAAVGPRCTLGSGIILCRNSVLTVNVSLGDHVHVNLASTCGHDAVLGPGCTLSAHCDVTGHAVLDRGVFLGSHASVTPGVHVGEFAVVGAGSVAFRNVPPGDTVVGVPSRSLFK